MTVMTQYNGTDLSDPSVEEPGCDLHPFRAAIPQTIHMEDTVGEPTVVRTGVAANATAAATYRGPSVASGETFRRKRNGTYTD